MINWFKSLISKNTSKVTLQSSEIDHQMRLGFDLHESGKDAEAAVIFKKILASDPFHADALFLLGVTVNKYGDKESAISLIKKAIASKGDEFFYHISLGDIFLSSQNFIEAANCYEYGVALEPNSISTLIALGSCYQHSRRFNAAIKTFTKVLEIQPNNHIALAKRGEVYIDSGKIDKATIDLKNAHELAPEDLYIFSTYLFTTNFSTSLSPKEIFIEHQKFDSMYGAGIHGKPVKKIQDVSPNRKLRIGYVSTDFRLHAVSCFFEPVLNQHDRSQYEIYCYHLHQITDEISLRLKSKSDVWIPCADWSDDDLFRKIQEDKIDILVDLIGHTSYNRLVVFARKPAPIQITWLGYINTTGLSCMDYRIVDHYSDPLGISDEFHSEKLLRLPNSQWCFSKLGESVAVSSLPKLTTPYILFASFNRFSKLTEKALSLWAKVLISVEHSKLLIVDVPMDEQHSTKEFFVHHGINVDRIELHDRLSYDAFVDMHHYVDIALDGHPYSGATSTCDSLWMGVPTLTLAGETSISRSTSSILKTLGMSDWIAHTEDEFVAIAKKQSSNIENLVKIRMGLRQRMQSSPLMDAALFTNNLEKAYREVWIEKCKEQQSNAENSIQ